MGILRNFATRQPKVSVYIPAYNAAQFLTASIDGILSQSLAPDEILVIDDGSKDATSDIASRYKEVTLIRHARNCGLSAARNTAMRAARNELVGSVDADCAADRMWLENLVPLFENPKIGGAGGRLTESFKETLADRWRCAHMQMDRGTERIHNPVFLHGCNGIFRRSAILGLGGYDETLLTAGDDVDISRRLTMSGWELCYEPSARVAHLRRDSVASVLRSYWQWTHFGFASEERVSRLRLRNIVRHSVLGNVRYLFGGLASDDLRNGRFELLWIDFLTLFYFPWRDFRERGRSRMQATDGHVYDASAKIE